MPRISLISMRLPTLLAVALSLSAPAASDDRTLTVMTYNVYFGSDVSAVMTAQPAEIPVMVAAAYRQTIASDFSGRAGSIAGIIADHRPHLIALQEVSLIRRQTPGDILAGQAAPNASDIVADFQPLLMEAIGERGLDYDIAARVRNIDVEMPMLVDDGSIDDVRLTTFDVVLSRGDITVSRVSTANYGTLLTSPLGFSVGRGYVALDVDVWGSTYRFVNTHLEALSADVRKRQAEELLSVLDGETLPIVLAGDFNSDAGAPPGDPAREVYDLLSSRGYEDAWRDGPGTGPTCCQDADLRNAESELSERIDHVFTRNVDALQVSTAGTVGDRIQDRAPSGVWPSDHAGVVVSLIPR